MCVFDGVLLGTEVADRRREERRHGQSEEKENWGNKDEEEGKNHKREMQSLIVASENR